MIQFIVVIYRYAETYKINFITKVTPIPTD